MPDLKRAARATLECGGRARHERRHRLRIGGPSDDVLFFTDIIEPGKSFTIHFNAPAERGEYPYLCTLPGHWQIMNGVMVVE